MSTLTFWAAFGISSNVPSRTSLFLISFGPVNITFEQPVRDACQITHTNLVIVTYIFAVHLCEKSGITERRVRLQRRAT